MTRSRRSLVVKVLVVSSVIWPAQSTTAVAVTRCGGWAPVPSPSVGSDGSIFNAVGSSPGATWGVGYYLNGTPYFQTLVERPVQGQWNVVPSPNLGLGGFLSSVAPIPDTRNWWSVGFGYVGSTRPTLIEYWTGQVWKIAPSPSPGSLDSLLNGIAALSTSDAWAVGDYADIGFSYVGLIEHWDGSSWSIVKSPSPGTEDFLLAVAPVSSNDVWAVGNTRDLTSNDALIEHWDGGSWSVTATPPLPEGAIGAVLSSLSATSSTDVWAVGWYGTTDPVGNVLLKTLVEHWDGISWSVVPSPNPLPGNNVLNGVTVASSGSVGAVGWANRFNGDPPQTLIEHWDGTSWVVVPTATTGTSSALSSVAKTPGSRNIWAVGTFDNDQGIAQTLVEQLC
jgi:hypothetical protein